jgi:hypothetical protein
MKNMRKIEKYNVYGFASDFEIKHNDDIALFICAPNSEKPIKFERSSKWGYNHLYEGSCNNPITFPIFGKYDGQGGIHSIIRDFNVERLEEVLGDSIENVIKVLYDVTYTANKVTEETMKSYIQYKEKLGINITDKMLKKEFEEVITTRKRYRETKTSLLTYGDYKKYRLYYDNLELTYTIDHAFIYEKCSSIYKETEYGYVYDLSEKIWDCNEVDIDSHENDCLKWHCFGNFMLANRLDFVFPYRVYGIDKCDWKKKIEYLNMIKEFIESNKITDEVDSSL